MSRRAWLILPTYDEAANLAAVVVAARAVLITAAPEGFRILVVDDASPDGTGAVADGLAAAHGDVEVLHRTGKGGLGSAYQAGFRRVLGEGATRVLLMDADGSHAAADLAALLERARSGADLVVGSRYVPGGGVLDWGWPRRLVSRAGCAYARRVLGVELRDLTAGLMCFSGEALERVGPAGLRSRGYAFHVELKWRALRAGLRVEEIPIVFAARRSGRSKMTLRIALEAGWMVPALRWAPSNRRGRLGWPPEPLAGPS